MIAFCSAVETSTDIVLCWKYRLWVDFKIETVLFLIITSAGQENKIYYEEMGAVTVEF